jgi:broad specificity phosphatase PhoE
MYGIAQGRTRQWLRELAKENGIPYINYTPPGAETTAQVRERAITFFRKLCQELLEKFGTNSSLPSLSKSDTSTSLPKQDHIQPLSRSVSSENITSYQQPITNAIRKRSSSTGNVQSKLRTNVQITTSCQSSIDSALDLSSISPDQRSISSSISTISRNSSFEKHRNLLKGLLHSPYENHFSDLDILIVSHGAVIRELIKHFACDLQTDIGQHLDTIQDIAPNTSVTRFKVTLSTTDDRSPTTTLELVDYHNKTHLINSNNEEINLDVVNKCNL